MFRKSDIGRKIKIINSRGSGTLITGKIYTIKAFLNKTAITTEQFPANKWVCADKDDFEFINEISNLKVGDKILITRDTQSLKQGDKKEILSFLNDDPNKIIVEGIIPGGWLKSSFVSKLVDLSEFRFKTFSELVLIHGLDIFNKISLPNFIINMLGRPVECQEILNEEDRFIFIINNDRQHTVYPDMLEKKDIPFQEVLITLKDQNTVEERLITLGYHVSSLDRYKAFYNKDIVDIISGEKETNREKREDYLIQALKILSKNDKYTINSNGVVIDFLFSILKICNDKINIKEDKKLNNKIEEGILPF